MESVTAIAERTAVPLVRTHTGRCGHEWQQALPATTVRAWEQRHGKSIAEATAAQRGELEEHWRPLACPACERPRPEETPAAKPSLELAILEALDLAGVNVAKHGHKTLDDFDPREDPAALEAAHAYVETWRSSRGPYVPRDWMFFYGAGSERDPGGKVSIGKLGNGKTQLAVMVARRLLELELLDPRKLVFTTAEMILLEAEATYKEQLGESLKAIVRHYADPDLLIIDEFGLRADPSPHALRVLDEITKKREARGTLWTSNLSLKVLAGARDQGILRIVDRIAGEIGDGGRFGIEFTGSSWRRKRLRIA